MRLGEILSLKWSDINEGQDTITIEDTKGNRPRVVPLEGAGPVIFRQPHVSKFIFTNSVGNRMAVTDTSKAFKRALVANGLGQFTFHDLRHTYASWYVQRGGDLYRLQQILGHKGPAMTQRYAHLRVEDLREPAQKRAQ
jgi:integrase